jgi:signal transduction histidine kinase
MRTHFLMAVYEVLALVSSSLPQAEMLSRALTIVRAAIEADAGLIHLAAAPEGPLELLSHQGLAAGEAAQVITHADLWQLLAARAAPWQSQGEPLPGFPFPYAIAAPISWKGTHLGVLTLICRQPPKWEAADVQVAAAVAEQIGIGLEMKQLNEQAKQAAIQAERARLARDLHDSVMQLLYSQSLFSDAAQKSLGQHHPAQAEQYLGRVGEIADQAVREMRLLIYQLRPLALTRDGLAAALQTRLQVVEQRVGIRASLTYTLTVPLPEEVETALYRIAEEALNNTLKHAQATEVKVTVQMADGAVCLRIEDNGRGFDLEDVQAGMGLNSMRERAASLHGTLAVAARPGSGVSVTACLPLALTPEET